MMSMSGMNDDLIRSVKIVERNEKLYTVFENDVNSLGLWLHKKKYMKGQKSLTCSWVFLSLASTCMQLYFAVQLFIKFYIQMQ